MPCRCARTIVHLPARLRLVAGLVEGAAVRSGAGGARGRVLVPGFQPAGVRDADRDADARADTRRRFDAAPAAARRGRSARAWARSWPCTRRADRGRAHRPARPARAGARLRRQPPAAARRARDRRMAPARPARVLPLRATTSRATSASRSTRTRPATTPSTVAADAADARLSGPAGRVGRSGDGRAVGGGAAERDLRLVDDDHQLTASMDQIWNETDEFLGSRDKFEVRSEKSEATGRRPRQ